MRIVKSYYLRSYYVVLGVIPVFYAYALKILEAALGA
jgi:hypothetical protein